MSGHFSVKNFDRFQHYKDRSPPWIRLYNSLLDDYDFARLPDASKAHLLAIWLLASRYDNKIPFDPDWVSRRINATDRVDLDILEKTGFIVVEQSCSKALAGRKQVANPETEESRGETEEREGAQSAPPAPEKSKPRSKGTRLSETWEPKGNDWDRAQKAGLAPREITLEGQKFRNYWLAKSGRDAVKLDWSRTWDNWILRTCEQKGRTPAVNGAAAIPTLWITTDAPEWPMFCERWRREHGKDPPATGSRKGLVGQGWHFPATYRDVATPP